MSTLYFIVKPDLPDTNGIQKAQNIYYTLSSELENALGYGGIDELKSLANTQPGVRIDVICPTKGSYETTKEFMHKFPDGDFSYCHLHNCDEIERPQEMLKAIEGNKSEPTVYSGTYF